MLRHFGYALLLGAGFVPFGMIANHMSFMDAFKFGAGFAALIAIAPFIGWRA
jgi:hypothetical protein